MKIVSPNQLNTELDLAVWPHFNAVNGDGLSVEFDITIDQSLSYFKGHFPQQAVLPGVVQVHWAGQLARRYFSCIGFTELKKTKFSHVILPNSRLRLNLSFNPQSDTLNYRYEGSQQRYSSGQIVFAESPDVLQSK